MLVKDWKYHFCSPSVYKDVLTFQSFQELTAQLLAGLADALWHGR